jgi:hypothetical protein
MKLRVLNYSRYQGHTSAPTAEVGAEGGAEKQERRKKKEEEEEVARSMEWVKWYEQNFARFPSGKDFFELCEFQKRGVTDELIIAAVQKAVADLADRPISYAKRIIENLFPYGVRTAEDWERHKAAKEAKKRKVADSKAPGAESPVDPVVEQIRAFQRAKKEVASGE